MVIILLFYNSVAHHTTILPLIFHHNQLISVQGHGDLVVIILARFRQKARVHPGKSIRANVSWMLI